jgi:hypothetical protein
MNLTMDINDKFFTWLKSLYLVLSAGHGWPHMPKFPAIILLIGTFFLIYMLFYRNNLLKNKIPFSLSLCTLIIIVSYFFFLPSAYPPRWSIHLLPFSTIGFIYIVYYLKLKLKIFKR